MSDIETPDTTVDNLSREVALAAEARLSTHGFTARAFKRVGADSWSLRANAVGSVVQNAVDIEELSR